MKGLQEFKIVIDEDKIQGMKRCIRGHVHVAVDENKVLRKEIKVKYICKAWTDWKEMNMGICGVQHFKNMQLLAKHKTVLHQAQDPPLEPGEHNLPFNFNIHLATLPPSFEGPYGRIKHRIKTVLRSSIMQTEAAKDTWEFQSAPISDLNTQKELAHPVAVDKTIYTKLGRFARPAKTIKVTLDKSGYVPGENILITIETNRDKAKDCMKHSIEANLRQVIQFIGSSIQSVSTQKRSIANILSTVVCDELPDTTCDMCTITMPQLIVPPTPPSGLTGVKIITLNYDVIISSKELDVKIPVVIGNVPLHMPSTTTMPADAPPSFEELGLSAIVEECDTEEP